MIAVEPQGFLKDDANVRRLCGLADVSRAGYYRRRGRRHRGCALAEKTPFNRIV
jgi:hypothetical protein